MTRSSEEIEREVEATRAGLDETVEALKSKMSPGQLIDELTHALKGTGASDMVGNLGAQVKENPIALAMIGAGMAWLMMGKGGSHHAAATAYTGVYPPDDPYYGLGADGSGARHHTGGGLGDLKDKAADAAHRAGEAVSHLGDGVKDAASHALHGAQAAGDRAAQMGHTVQRTFMDTLDKEPLVIGALGLAVGAAIGASLPSTPLEDRTFGKARDHLLDEGKTRAHDLLDKGKDAVEAAYEGIRDVASGPDGGGSLVDKAEEMVRAGVEAAKGSIEEGRAH